MDYESLLRGVPETPEYLFRTSRGSTYAQFSDNQTIRNRSSEKHQDKRSGLQPRSGKTIYMSLNDAISMGGLFQNPDLGVQLVPLEFNKETGSGKASLQLLEDYGPRKKASSLMTAPFSMRPQVGMVPVEIYNSQSPIGDVGKGVHFGTPIKEVIDKNAIRKTFGKLGLGIGAGATLASVAKSAQAGEYRKILEELGELAIPLGLTPTELGAGVLPEYQRQIELVKEMTPAQRRTHMERIEKQRDKFNYAFGGRIEAAGRNRLV